MAQTALVLVLQILQNTASESDALCTTSGKKSSFLCRCHHRGPKKMECDFNDTVLDLRDVLKHTHHTSYSSSSSSSTISHKRRIHDANEDVSTKRECVRSTCYFTEVYQYALNLVFLWLTELDVYRCAVVCKYTANFIYSKSVYQTKIMRLHYYHNEMKRLQTYNPGGYQDVASAYTINGMTPINRITALALYILGDGCNTADTRECRRMRQQTFIDMNKMLSCVDDSNTIKQLVVESDVPLIEIPRMPVMEYIGITRTIPRVSTQSQQVYPKLKAVMFSQINKTESTDVISMWMRMCVNNNNRLDMMIISREAHIARYIECINMSRPRCVVIDMDDDSQPVSYSMLSELFCYGLCEALILSDVRWHKDMNTETMWSGCFKQLKRFMLSSDYVTSRIISDVPTMFKYNRFPSLKMLCLDDITMGQRLIVDAIIPLKDTLTHLYITVVDGSDDSNRLPCMVLSDFISFKQLTHLIFINSVHGSYVIPTTTPCVHNCRSHTVNYFRALSLMPRLQVVSIPVSIMTSPIARVDARNADYAKMIPSSVRMFCPMGETDEVISYYTSQQGGRCSTVHKFIGSVFLGVNVQYTPRTYSFFSETLEGEEDKDHERIRLDLLSVEEERVLHTIGDNIGHASYPRT